jgi:hypothetical protein
MGIRHSTVATAADEAGAEVNKTEWNDDHVIDDGSLTIAKTTGLQTALDGKQATIGDGDLTIARTSGLQTALDGKQATIGDGDLTIARTSGLQTALNDKSIKNRPECLIVAAGDETTAIETGTGKVEFQMPYAFTLTAVRATVTTAPTTSGTLTVDINEGGTSILSTKLTIDINEKTSTSAATAAVISDTALADSGVITVDVDAVSGGATETGLKIYLIGYQT